MSENTHLLVKTAYSTYEIDMARKRVRRLTSSHEPTPRQSADGEWQEYENLWLTDRSVMFQWGWNDDGSARCTRTSDIDAATELQEMISGNLTS
jgi:hypothetical protein